MALSNFWIRDDLFTDQKAPYLSDYKMDLMSPLMIPSGLSSSSCQLAGQVDQVITPAMRRLRYEAMRRYYSRPQQHNITTEHCRCTLKEYKDYGLFRFEFAFNYKSYGGVL